MTDLPMVGYAYRYTSSEEAPRRVREVAGWAFTLAANSAFDGFGLCVRYEVVLVLPIMDGDRAIRGRLRDGGYANPQAFVPTISARDKLKAQVSLERKMRREHQPWDGNGLPYP